MPRATLVQNQFTRGELSPRMEGRTDLEQYFQGCRTQVNFLSLPHGGATRRPGSVHVAEIADSDAAGRLRPFVFSTSDAYVLEFGAGTLRFFRDRGRIVAPETDAAIVNGGFDDGIGGWTDRSTGRASIGHDAANRRLDLAGADDGAAAAAQRVEIGAPHRSSRHVLRFDVAGANPPFGSDPGSDRKTGGGGETPTRRPEPGAGQEPGSAGVPPALPCSGPSAHLRAGRPRSQASDMTEPIAGRRTTLRRLAEDFTDKGPVLPDHDTRLISERGARLKLSAPSGVIRTISSTLKPATLTG